MLVYLAYDTKKKSAYEEAFYQFEPKKIAAMTEQDVDNLMTFLILSITERN